MIALASNGGLWYQNKHLGTKKSDVADFLCLFIGNQVKKRLQRAQYKKGVDTSVSKSMFCLL